jgi:hypothetical protein
MLQAERYYIFVYETLRMTQDDIKRIAALWQDWVQARTAQWSHLRSVAASLSRLPVLLPVSPKMAAALGDTRQSFWRHSALRAVSRPHWACGLLGASHNATADATTTMTLLRECLTKDSLLFARFHCTLLHSGRGFDAEQAARVLARWPFDNGFRTADCFRVAEMAFNELRRQGALQ